MIKNLLSLSLLLLGGFSAALNAQEPDGYYVKAEGAKKEQLKTSLSGIVNAGATTISYSGLWTAYKKTDVREDGSTFGNGTYPGLKQWQLDVLLKWHRQDPVSEREIKRNNAVFSVQKNRNPFVDHPELAEHIWGTKMNEAWQLSSSLNEISSLKIFGNSLRIHLNGITSPVSYRVFNVSGSLVAQGSTDTDCIISLNRTGIYIISVQTGTSVINKKISL